MLLVDLAQRSEQIALFFRLHARRRREVQNWIATGTERRPLIGGGKKALPVDGRSGPDTALEQHYKSGQVLVLRTEPVQNPRTEAGTADPCPSTVDQELRL